MSSRIIGIDLGTTNSLVAYVDEATGLPRVIPDADGRPLLPSVVAFTPDGIVVGEPARRQLARRPADTVYSVKRLMGRGFEDVKDEARYLPFRILAGEGLVRLAVGGREVTPPEVSAVVLKALKERAERHFGESVEKAVVTVPAYFNDAQRQATKDAGRIAGLDVVRIVNEPTAASLAYGLHRLSEGVVAVYDLGGGTFDVSILRVKDGVFEVLATNGDTHLGGDDFDRVLALWLLEDIAARHHTELDRDCVDLARDPEAMQELRLAAEAAKIRVSSEERTTLTLPFAGFTYRREMTRADLESLGGIVNVLIPRNTTIPTSAREMFTTSADGQTLLDLHVLQGERELAKDCRSLGRFELRIDPMPAGMPKIEVTFLIDANGILQVQAKEQRSDKAASIEVKPTYGLNEAEVGRMIEDSFTYAEADVETRMLIEARNEADTVLVHAGRALKQGAHLVDVAERAAIETAVAALRAARSGDDRDRIHEATTAVNRATEHLAEVLMDAALKGALGSRRATEILGER